MTGQVLIRRLCKTQGDIRPPVLSKHVDLCRSIFKDRLCLLVGIIFFFFFFLVTGVVQLSYRWSSTKSCGQLGHTSAGGLSYCPISFSLRGCGWIRTPVLREGIDEIEGIDGRQARRQERRQIWTNTDTCTDADTDRHRHT